MALGQRDVDGGYAGRASLCPCSLGAGASTRCDCTGVGFAADAYLAANGGGSGYGDGLYWIAIFGTPSATGDWAIMFGGHHMAYNLAFTGGIGYPTPNHLGVEPKAAFGLSAEIGFRLRLLSVSLEARVDLPAEGSASAPDTRVRSWLVAGTLVPCVRPSILLICGLVWLPLRGLLWNRVFARNPVSERALFKHVV